MVVGFTVGFEGFVLPNYTDEPVTYIWDFGDATSGSGQSPVHTFPDVVPYEVCLIIFNDHPFGCQDTVCQTIFLEEPTCFAYFTSSSDGLTTVFTDSSFASIGSVISWNWDFDDGFTSTDVNPVHTFADYGQYAVCLTIVSDIIGSVSIPCTDVYCDTLTFEEPILCEANFTYEQTGNTVNFTDLSAIVSGVDEIMSWTWTAGDGTTSTQQNPTYTYPTSGTYEVCLTILTVTGCTSTFCDTLTVSDCAADFSYTSTISDGFLVSFTDELSTDFGDITAWNWTLSNGSTSTQQNPTVALPPGIYTACLTITTSLNCTDTFCDTLTLGSCTAAFESTVSGLTVSLQNTSTTDFRHHPNHRLEFW